MRYSDAGLDKRSDDTIYLTNFIRNIRLWMSLAPAGSIIFGTRLGTWRTYFADHVDRMRDANSTVSNLWLMIDSKNKVNDTLRRQLRGAIDRALTAERTTKVAQVRADSWVEGCKRMAAQRDECRDEVRDLKAKLKATEAELDEQVAAKGRANRHLDRTTYLATLMREQRDEARGAHSVAARKLRDANADLRDEQEDHAHTLEACQQWREMAEDRERDGDLKADTIADHVATIKLLTKRIAFTQDCNVNQAHRIGNLERRNDQQYTMIRSAVAELKGRGDMYASLVKAIDILEGRDK
jgi:chromosome segregation ATPase